MIATMTAALIAALAWLTWRDIRLFKAFLATDDPGRRLDFYRSWVSESLLFFTVIGIVSLAVIGHVDTIVRFPAAFTPLSDGMRLQLAGDDGVPLTGGQGARLVLIVVAANLIGGIIREVIAARTPSAKRAPVMAMLPRNSQERRWAAALSIAAGIGEEIFFRVLMPLLLVLLGIPPITAFIAAGILFGLCHFYQGWMGMLAVTIVGGGLFAAIYLVTQQLWFAALFHAIIDLNALVFAPLLSRALRR